MCCLVLATNPGNWAWITGLILVTEPGYLSLANGVWTTRFGSWSWLIVLGSRRIVHTFSGSVTSGVWWRRVALSEFVDPSYVHARLLLRCWYSRVTCYPCSIVDITVTFQFSLVYLCDRTCVNRTLFCVRVACTSELTLRTLLYINCITYWVLRDVV